MTFEDFQEKCEYRTYHDNKCVHDDNEVRRKVNSCAYEHCPLKEKFIQASEGVAPVQEQEPPLQEVTEPQEQEQASPKQEGEPSGDKQDKAD